MSAYRFCRTDDIALLVDALNRCWAPYVPDEPLMTPAAFKRWIRDLQVWCSSCMVAFSGPDPVGVLIGAKRASGTLIHKIAVHPDHRRQGHGRHLLASLGSKLAILGPPRIVAEVPESLAPACALFRESGYLEEAVLTDYVLTCDEADIREANHVGARHAEAPEGAKAGEFVIPVTVDDLVANGLLEDANPQVCWERSVETITASKHEIAGFAVASDERIEAYVLSMACASGTEIVSLREFNADVASRLRRLLARVNAAGTPSLLYKKVHPSEVPHGMLEAVRFRPAERHVRYTARAQSA
jgi:GNAT superfamily N-acetyltransferase